MCCGPASRQSTSPFAILASVIRNDLDDLLRVTELIGRLG
jgi:hypothetical protein